MLTDKQYSTVKRDRMLKEFLGIVASNKEAQTQLAELNLGRIAESI
jgi:hypothetical protein